MLTLPQWRQVAGVLVILVLIAVRLNRDLPQLSLFAH